VYSEAITNAAQTATWAEGLCVMPKTGQWEGEAPAEPLAGIRVTA
jgi:hypothetical protein